MYIDFNENVPGMGDSLGLNVSLSRRGVPLQEETSKSGWRKKADFRAGKNVQGCRFR